MLLLTNGSGVGAVQILGSGSGSTGVQNAVFNIGSFTTTDALGNDVVYIAFNFYRTAGATNFFVGLSNAINTSPQIYGDNTNNTANQLLFDTVRGFRKNPSDNSIICQCGVLDITAAASVSQYYAGAYFNVSATETFYINMDATAGNCTLTYSWIAWRIKA